METKPNNVFKPDNARLCLHLRFKTMLGGLPAGSLGEKIMSDVNEKVIKI